MTTRKTVRLFLRGSLLEHQRQEPGPIGSWNPEGDWAETGGRVYQTALCTLMLEVYYRYLPLYTIGQPIDAVGTIVGEVTDATTGAPVPGAAIRLNLPDRDTIVVMADAMGRYSLPVPQVPEFFALSASREGFVPHSRNVDAAMLNGAPLSLDFNLVPANEAVVAVESVPDVHHLGDNKIEIIARPSSADIDDFEFVNVRILLAP